MKLHLHIFPDQGKQSEHEFATYEELRDFAGSHVETVEEKPEPKPVSMDAEPEEELPQREGFISRMLGK